MNDFSFGLTITVTGMSLVFSALALLWGILNLLTRFDQPAAAESPDLMPEPEPEVTTADSLSPEELAAITIAVRLYAATLRQEAAPTVRSYWPGSLLFASRWVAAGRTRQNQSWQRRR
ncbi:OadG family protein [Chloroflexus sp.]|uniref:OadG family protein n=1 Tax=Chloroflexus sp. TaxID=1904827 RepID=UPI002ADE87A8|nr:OadG family protein [Chloroflexus sp.]